MLGYAAYVIPLVLVVIGWHYFWCRTLDAVYTKLAGAALLFGCMSSFLSLAFGTVELSGKEFRAGGFVGERLAALAVGVPESDRVDRSHPDAAVSGNHPVDPVFVRASLLGHLPDGAGTGLPVFAASMRERREERRREKQRQEVLKKHLSKQPKDAKGRSARAEGRRRPQGRASAADGHASAANRCAGGEGRLRGPSAGATQTVEDRGDGERRRRRAAGCGQQAHAGSSDQAAATDALRAVAAAVGTRQGYPPSGGRARSRCPRTRSSTRPGRSGRSMSGS